MIPASKCRGNKSSDVWVFLLEVASFNLRGENRKWAFCMRAGTHSVHSFFPTEENKEEIEKKLNDFRTHLEAMRYDIFPALMQNTYFRVLPRKLTEATLLRENKTEFNSFPIHNNDSRSRKLPAKHAKKRVLNLFSVIRVSKSQLPYNKLVATIFVPYIQMYGTN